MSMQVPSDVLLRLLVATEEIRDLLRQKADQENSKLKVLVLIRVRKSDNLLPTQNQVQKVTRLHPKGKIHKKRRIISLRKFWLWKRRMGGALMQVCIESISSLTILIAY